MGKKSGSTCLVTDSHRSRNRKEEGCHTKPNYAGSNVLHLPLDTCEQTATNLKQKISIFRTISSYSSHLILSENCKQELLNCEEEVASAYTYKYVYSHIQVTYKCIIYLSKELQKRDLCQSRNKSHINSFLVL